MKKLPFLFAMAILAHGAFAQKADRWLDKLI